MRTIPVDVSRMRFAAIDVVPVTVYETGEVKTNKEGVPAWRVNTLCVVDGEAGGETVAVRLNAVRAPDFPPLTSVVFDGLSAMPWSQEGRSGVAFLADGVSAEASSVNGRAKAGERVVAETVGS